MLPAAFHEINALLEETARELQRMYQYPAERAQQLVSDYNRLFRDSTFCSSLPIPPQDDAFFLHEGPIYLALRIHYYLVLKLDPAPDRFIDWVLKYEQSLVDAGQVDEHGRLLYPGERPSS